ncbi:MAG: ribose 5-phosphate isomerase B [Bacteroidales bacterium]|jgi:ribose 5-phosphate isomerase B|nr:ribose 5-phosphate isomerase B [Bacteroidales bacterium]
MEKILIGADHAGFKTKEFLKQALTQKGYQLEDMGTYSIESVDYPDIIHPLAQKINSGEYARAIILCGSGNGVNMTANKYPHVRSALCWEPQLAVLARQHNDANVVALPARFIDLSTALLIAEAFLTTPFEGGRHAVRVAKI